MPGRHIHLSLSEPRAEALHQGLISTDIDEGVVLFRFSPILRLLPEILCHQHDYERSGPYSTVHASLPDGGSKPRM